MFDHRVGVSLRSERNGGRPQQPGLSEHWDGSSDQSAGDLIFRSGRDSRNLVLSPDITLEPGQWQQLNSVLSQAGFTNGYALIERISGSAPYLAYAVINDNVTNDGSFVPAIPSTGSGCSPRAAG